MSGKVPEILHRQRNTFADPVEHRIRNSHVHIPSNAVSASLHLHMLKIVWLFEKILKGSCFSKCFCKSHSDLNDYPLSDDLYTCIERVQAKPFDSDHVEQVTAAEQLYGRQLTFRISHEELRSELNMLSEAYSPDILQRAERVLLEQKRKHSWLF